MNIILDMGSGNGNGNDPDYIKASIDAIADIDTGRHKVYLKYQLFTNAPPNKPFSEKAFNYAYKYGKAKGYQVTASVFDSFSTKILLQYDIPFVKIANRPDLYYYMYYMGGEKVIVSYTGNKPASRDTDCTYLACISEYPATVEQYEDKFSPFNLRDGISDHTVGFDLFNKHQPFWWEKHFVLERTDDNPDAGPFAVMPDDLRGVL